MAKKKPEPEHPEPLPLSLAWVEPELRQWGGIEIGLSGKDGKVIGYLLNIDDLDLAEQLASIIELRRAQLEEEETEGE